MTQTDFVAFTSIELLVNSIPFYFGGPIEKHAQQAAVKGMIRLHQMNGIKKKINKPTNDLVNLLVKELAKPYKALYHRELEITTEIRAQLGYLIKEGVELKSDYETLINELAVFKIECISNNLNLEQVFAMAKEKGIERPEGSWEPVKKQTGRIGKMKGTRHYWASYRDETSIVWQLKEKAMIPNPPFSKKTEEHTVQIYDSVDLFSSCADFSSQFLVSIKNNLKAWPKDIKTLLETA